MDQEVSALEQKAQDLVRREALHPLGAELVIQFVRVGNNLRETRIG